MQKDYKNKMVRPGQTVKKARASAQAHKEK
jgi:hypothetical protein